MAKLVEKSGLNADIPVCVDLDGTLIHTDLLYEGVVRLLKNSPWLLVMLPIWLWTGKARLKQQIAQRVKLVPELLPFNKSILNFLQAECENKDREIVLVTGSDQDYARSIANHLGFFDKTYGSDGKTNLTAENKCELLCSLYGEKGFDYIGNDKDDLKVWSHARQAMRVSSFIQPMGTSIKFERTFEGRKARVIDYIKMLRVHQWSKNLLIFVPLILDHRLNETSALWTTLLAFFSMSLLASGTYIVNDLFDLDADRQHESKKYRALPAGVISIKNAIGLAFVLLAASAILSITLVLEFQLLLMCYLLLTLYYSFFLKSRMVVDLVTISLLHTLRIVAGTVVINAAWSFWLLTFALFIFFSLAAAKRVSELQNIKARKYKKVMGRSYVVEDINVLTSSGTASGFISILVVALYINGAKANELYAQPFTLWLVCPVLMYWIGRIWIVTGRGDLHEDPIVFAIKDRVSYLVAILLGVIVYSANM